VNGLEPHINTEEKGQRTTMSHGKLLRALSATLIVVLLAGCTSRTPATPTPTTPGFEISVEDLNGKPVKLSAYRGKVVVVNFWAIWCGPCRAELPDLNDTYEQYHDKEVVILAVNISESASDIKSFAAQNNLTLPMMRDVDNKESRVNQIEAIPTTLFVDRQGQVRKRQVGMMTKDFMVQQIEALLR